MENSNTTKAFAALIAIYINCTLKKSPHLSHTQGLIDVSKHIMKSEGVTVKSIRFVDYDIAFGVQPDMTEKGVIEKDEWPALFEEIKAADILVIGSPIWLGERSSVASQLIERLYAMSTLKNDKGQYIYYGKAGGCIITGNEDGVKHCSSGILYALQHIGYTIPPQADTGWLGKIGPGPSYRDEEAGAFDHDFTNRNTTFMAYNLMHLAKMLKDNNGYPASGNVPEEWENGERWAFENARNL